MARTLIMAAWVLAGVFAVVALGAGAILAILYGAGVRKSSAEELAAMLAPGFEVVEPAGRAGPHPTVILFHGCGGLRNFNADKTIMREYAAAAADAGYAAVIVDSLGPRGIDFQRALDRVCGGTELRGAERAGDVVAATAWVKTQTWADPSQIVLAGWSHGAWSVMDAMTHDLRSSLPQSLSAAPADALAGVVGVHLTYPYVGPLARSWRNAWAATPATRLVLVVGDTITPAERALPVVDRLEAAGVDPEVVVLEGVTHGFDERDHVDGSSFVFDEARAREARANFVGFLQRVAPRAPEAAPRPPPPSSAGSASEDRLGAAAPTQVPPDQDATDPGSPAPGAP